MSTRETPVRHRRGTWNEKSLKQALAAIKTEKLPAYKASERYGIPRRTLRRYLQNNLEVKSKLGNRFTLTDAQNDELVAQLLALADKGYPITTRLLRTQVYNYCEYKGIKHNFSTEKRAASYQWVQRFIRKNPRFVNQVYRSVGPHHGYDPNLIPAEDLELIRSLNDESSSPMNEQQLASDEKQPPASLPQELSGIPEPELRQHAMSLCNSLLAEYESHSDEGSEHLQIDVKDKCKLEDSFNEESLDDDKHESVNGERLEEPALPESSEKPVEEKRRSRRGRHASWSEDALREALAAIRLGRLTTLEAVQQFKIPRSTLRRYLKMNRETKAKLGTKLTFNAMQNEDFCTQIRQLSSRGYSVTTNFLRAFVYKFCEENGIKHSFSQEKRTASYKWLQGFLRKNPELLEYVHKNTVDPEFVPELERIEPAKVTQAVDSGIIDEEASTSAMENQIFVNCESPLNSETEASDGEASPDEDPLELTEKKKTYSKWSQVVLDQALKAIKSNELSTHRAAKIYGVPRSTLRRYLLMEKSNGTSSKKGNRSILDDRQIKEVCAELQILANNGIPLTMRTIKSRIFEYCEKHGIKNSFPPNKRLASYKVARTFVRNNPAIQELMRTQTFDGHYGTVMILDDEEEYKPAFVECELNLDDDDSSSQGQMPINLPIAANHAQALTNGNFDNAHEGISFPESIGLFEMVAGAYEAS